MTLKTERKLKASKYRALPKTSLMVLIGLVIFSGLVHLGSLVQFPGFKDISATKQRPSTQKVKIKLVKKEKPPKDLQDQKKILEAKQEETEKPEKADYKGYQNHATKKQTKIKKALVQKKALDPGQSGIEQKTQKNRHQKKSAKQANKTKKTMADKRLRILSDPNGSLEINAKDKQEFGKNGYKSLLPSAHDLQQQVAAGYQDYIDDKLEEGDKIDINTTDYRFIGYFTSMRKAIELVWNYPASAARRGHQGVVGLQFTIFKNGAVKDLKVIRSSGYKSLDNAIVEAIRLTSPFSPLPDGFGKKQMTITGNFRYVLNSFAGH